MKKIIKTSPKGYVKCIFYLFVLMIISLAGFSQNVSINTTGNPPNASAGVDIDFTSNGLLIPRLALTSTNSFAPLQAHVAGMIVYNTATTGDVSPGYYFNNGVKWVAGLPYGNAAGNMFYWDGTAWVIIPAGQPGQLLQLNISGNPSWSVSTYNIN
jgi:hypothetical protein